VNPCLFSASLMMAKTIMKEGYKYGSGLGINGKGSVMPLKLVENKGRYGLGYKLTHADRRTIIEERIERSRAKVEGRESRTKEIHMCSMDQSFYSARWINVDQVAAIKQRHGDQSFNLVHPCLPDEEIGNWESVDIPVVFTRDEIYDDVCFENNYSNILYPNFADPDVNMENDDYEENCEPSPELLRLVEQEVREIKLHQEEVEMINLGNKGEEKKVKIGTSLIEEIRQQLYTLLKEFKDIFAWSYEDMPGLDPEIIQHRLPLKPECHPIKQRLRIMKSEVSLKIKEEVKKQFNAEFLAIAQYPQWVANVVSVPKKGGKVRMCVDYRDLNRASPKDDFPLPHIDTLVDNTTTSSLYSFMDEFSGYNQIKMAPEDIEKTTFITLWGTFCYKVISFGLKNAGATYQRAMVTLFHDMMQKKLKFMLMI